MTSLDWLHHIYAHTDTGWVSLFAVDRTTGEKFTDWASIDNLEQLAAIADERASTCCVWFGVAPRAERLPNGRRGGATDCLTIPALWLDVDIASEVHAAEDLPATHDDALALLTDFPVLPTAVVDSGHGIQAWWLLDEPIEGEHAASLLADWGTTWAELGRRRSWHVDNVFDMARVMRLPGSFNRKADPRPVTVLGADWTRTYSPDDITPHLIEAPAVDPEIAVKRTTPYIGPERPGDAYNVATDPATILTGAGCHFDHTDDAGNRHFRAPHRNKKTDTTGMTVYLDGHTTIWSETFARDHGMKVRNPYDAYGLYAHIEHRGDFSAATAALRAQGYGADGWAPTQIAQFVPRDMTEPPLPLEVEHRFGPSFPIEAMPDWIAAQCEQVAHAFQVPVDLPAMLAIGSLATLCTGAIKVNLTGSSWTEHVNLYLVSALLPGSGKSPVFKAMTKPVVEIEQKSIDGAKERRRDHEATRRILEGQVKQREAEAIKAPDNDRVPLNAYLDVVNALENHKALKPHDGQVIAEDITPEALVELLAENGGRMALLSSEGGVFDMMAGQYVDKGKATNLAVYLQGWSGDPVRRKRTKAEAQVIPEALLNVCVTTQPGVIKALGANRELVTKGVPVRFMYSVPPSLVGFRDRHRVFDDLNASVSDTYRRRMVEIGQGCLDATAPTVLQMAPEVAKGFTDWDQRLEERQKPGGDLAERAEWVAKLRATIMRLCGLLHVAEGRSGVIQPDTLTCALKVADYWLEHANVVEAMWRSDMQTDKARTIVQWAIDTNRDTFTLRDAYTAKRGSFPTVADVVEPMQVLVDRGWIEPLQDGPVRALGPAKPSQQFRLRSDAARWFETDAQYAQYPETDPIARIARIARKGEVSNPTPYDHTFSAPETSEPHAQYAQYAQYDDLAPTGTDDLPDIF